MGIRETIQNRATNQSAAWGVIAAVLAPLVGAFTTSEFLAKVPIENLIFSFAIVVMFLLFIRDDKIQEHTTAAAALTNPKVTEQLSDRFMEAATALKSMELETVKTEVKKCIEEMAREAASKTE